MKKTVLSVIALGLAFSTMNAMAMTAQKKGRIVVFGDKKEGAFKSDLSIKVGTMDDLKNLKLVESQKGIHACFVGSKDSIKPLVENMITSANKAETSDELMIKNFDATKDASIHVEVLSHDAKPYLHLQIDPC